MAKPGRVSFAYVAFGLAIAAVGALVGSLSWNASSVQQQLDTRGVYGTATIDAKQAAPRKSFTPKDGQPMIRPQYFVSYSFQASDGSRYASEATVSETFFVQYDVGATTPVRYVPDNPRYSEVEFGRMATKNYAGLLGGGLFVLIGLGFAGVALFKPRMLKN